LLILVQSTTQPIEILSITKLNLNSDNNNNSTYTPYRLTHEQVCIYTLYET
jgi:hypothetical protein